MEINTYIQTHTHTVLRQGNTVNKTLKRKKEAKNKATASWHNLNALYMEDSFHVSAQNVAC